MLLRVGRALLSAARRDLHTAFQTHESTFECTCCRKYAFSRSLLKTVVTFCLKLERLDF